MFDKKADVDRHVEICLKKINSERDRNLRSFAFAKLYLNVGELELARRYISSYLTVKPNSAEAHQFLGKILEKLGRRDAALEEYRNSLDLDPKQSGLILKVCELLAEDETMEPSSARFWCEQAQQLDLQNQAVFNLKERLISSESKNPEELCKLLLSEMELRPNDVSLRVRLLNHYLQNNQINEAYKHVTEVENNNLSAFANNFIWYETLTKVLVRYKNENFNSSNLKWDFWILIITVLDKLAMLSMDENSMSIKPLTECTNNVFNLDQMLLMACEKISESCKEKQYSQEFCIHYKAQLCFHIATLVFKQARKDQITFKEAINFSLPLLLISYHSQPADLQSVWLEHANESVKKRVQQWHREASFRCSQAGHILQAFAKGRRSNFTERIMQLSSGPWKEKTFKNIFITRDQQMKIKTSYFIKNSQLDDITVKLPDSSDLFKYDETAQLLYPDSLHNLIWIGLNNQLPKFKCTAFEGLQYSVKNLNNCAAETLNILDIEAFVYCCILCAQSQLEDSKQFIYYNQEKPNLLAACITEPLGNTNQVKWFSSAYRMIHNEYTSDISDLRVTLIKGIEIVRCIGSHGLDVKLLVQLANIFSQKINHTKKQSEIEHLEIRAELYWKAALTLLEKLRSNLAITYPLKRWFEYHGKDMTPTEINNHIEEGKLFLALQFMKKKDHEKALQILENLRSPYASFYQAQTYSLLADEQMSHNKESLTSEMRSQNIILLSKARDCFYLTLDRLREPTVERKHPLNTQLGTEIEKIERMLSRIDPDTCGLRNEDNISDENVSSVGSAGDHVHNSYLAQTSFLNGNLTPRNDVSLPNPYYNLDISMNHSRRIEARPSPERLDAQLRQMVASKDAAISHILEQNKMMVDSHRNLVDELRSFKEAVTTLTLSVDELKGIRKSVEELKEAVDDLQNLKETVEQVHEIKKDLAELKKDTTKLKNNQINDEDLYALEEEYNVDYGLGANATGFNATPFYPNFPQRLQGPNALAYGAGLYGMYPMYSYGGIGLGQPGTLPFPEGQIPDLRTIGSIGQGLSHTGLAQPQVTVPQPGLSNMFNKYDNNAVPTFSAATPPQRPLQNPAPTAFSLPNTTPVSSFTTTNNTVNSLPVNVVITASDPLPTTSVSPQILSVTIPPQHLKGNQQAKKQPHNYQIPLPTTTAPLSFPTVNQSISSVPLPVSTQNLLSNVAKPIFSSLSIQNSQQTTLVGTSPNQKSNNSNTILNETSKSNQNNSNVSESSVLEEHDPCPDFKPIIPLPDEIHVTTGEENEIILFCERAKLFRFVDKEWKERGIGNIKILHNEEAGKVRILMRREQVHKICANHFLTPDMTLSTMPNNDRAFVWAANDFSDENVVLEKLCIRFKNSEIANKFQECFNHAKTLVKTDQKTNKEQEDKIEDIKNSLIVKLLEPAKKTEPQIATSLGGFIFTSTPTFMDKMKVQSKPTTPVPASKPSPFAGFSFTPESKSVDSTKDDKSNTDFKPLPQTPKTQTILKQPSLNIPAPKVVNLNDSGNAEEFVPTAEFKPVIPLPELVEVKTGEENSEVLYEVKAKLLRFDSESKEWKERGIGIMKILKEKTIRLVMRREQIHKVCCNHQLLKSMVFTNMPKNNKVLNWCAQDYSDNVLKTEMFAIRFRTPELCDEFLKMIQTAQSMMDSSNNVNPDYASGFKTVQSCKNTLECPVCSHRNENKRDKCTACGSNLDGSSKSDNAQSPQKFKPSTSPQPAQTWPDKPKHVSTWECKICFVHNDGKKNHCEACDTPKNEAVAKKDASIDKNASGDFSFDFITSFNSSNISGGSSFGFGQKNVSTQENTTQKTNVPSSSNWGDKFKPKVGSWECKSCYVSNSGDTTQCVACLTPKDKPKEDIPKTTTSTAITTSSWGDLYKPKPGSWSCNICYISNTGDVTQCVACETPKEGTAQNTVSSTTSNWGDLFKPKEGSWSCKACYVNNTADATTCVACNASKDGTIKTQGVDLSSTGSKFIFGKPSTTTELIFGAKTTSAGFTFGFPQTSTTTPTTGFTFGIPKSTVEEKTTTTSTPPVDLQSKTTFNFSISTPKEVETKKSSSKEEFVFGSPNKYDFEFKPRSPRKVSGGDGEDSDGSVAEDEGEHIYFKPVIPLPDKVEVKTGEEQEEVLYCHRAKLFRFTSGEWKERGIGDIKILKHKETGKLRVVMRREQVLKICLNHALTKDINYTVKDDRTWLFSSPDYSEGEINYQQFCIRFKNAEVAKQFMEAIDNARADLNESVSDDKQSEDDDVVLVYELRVTPEEEKKALELQLPKNFYAYLQKPPCKGCIGCNPDDFVFDTKSEKKSEKTETKSDTPVSSFASVAQNNNTTSVIKPTTSTFSFVSSTATSSPFVFSTSTTSNQSNIFSTPPSTNQSKALSTSTISNQSNIFSTPQTSTQTQSIINTSITKTPTTFSFKLPSTNTPSAVSTPTSTTAVSEHKSPIAPAKFSSGSITGSIFSTPKDQSGKTIFSGSPTIFGDPKAKPETSTPDVLPKSTPKTEQSSVLSNLLTSTQKTNQSNIFSANKDTSTFKFTKPETTEGFTFGTSFLKTNTDQPVFGGIKTDQPVFGNIKSDQPIFGGAKTDQPTFGSIKSDQPVFGGVKSVQPIFGVAKTDQPTFGSIKSDQPVFGGVKSDQPIFGGAKTDQPTFGSIKSDQPVLGGIKTDQSIFGGAKPDQPTFGSIKSDQPIFGGIKTDQPTFGSLKTDQPTFGSIKSDQPAFGSTMFGGAKPADKPMFGATFGSFNQPQQQSAKVDPPVLQCDTGLSFAALASENSTFISKDDSKSFMFEGAGTPVFGAKSTKPAEKSTTIASANTSEVKEDDAEASGAGDDNYDPHYEPIIPLPDQIVVKTGEEDEEVLFIERAKLYRFTEGQWKERGVGQIKILHHPVNRSYRFLMRREQVHKLVLNQLITSDLDIQQMQTSDRAWCWGGYNHSEDGASLEKLAVRFKNAELAQLFYNAVQSVIEKINSNPKTSQKDTEEEDEDHGDNDDENDDYNSDESDERSIMFVKRCTLSMKEGNEWKPLCMGQLKIYYDSDLYGGKIVMYDDNGEQISNTIIAVNTVLKVEDTSCIWRAMEWALDPAVPRILKAKFSSHAAAQEMYYNFEECLQYAQQSEIVDNLPKADF